ncbi:hypothetical protein C2869_00915 [Saccharobesus litoralis]|uniref:HTH araC/xylS-type domain-containing protein n=1 Tax=Saccharobesus litoralis TaxID=2172099 RepID=A0A2S0VLK6_9ALTE|nr:helix-turn-helix domain-containing protein [Saccharobesus litoralis]AWB65088.1 hypothetical protein C2869_00915 [Saccharobesus litoralis]
MQLTDGSYTTIEEYIDAIQEASLDAMQLSSGVFNNRHKLVASPDLILGYRTTEGETLNYGTIANEHYFFVVPQLGIEYQYCGLEMADEHLIVCDNKRDIVTRHAAVFHGITISIDKTILHRYLGIYGKTYVDLCLETTFNQLVLPKAIQIKTKLLAFVTRVLDGSLDYQNATLQQDVLDTVALLLVELIEPVFRCGNTSPPSMSTRQNVVMRSLQFINETAPNPITINELCQASFCSVRTLEYAFKTILKMTPKQYLIQYRLHQIRKQLLGKPSEKITPLLKNYGIVNTGRFANDYFKLFGEYPKQTMRFAN